MRFNSKKCYVMRINNKSSHFYSLCGHILQQVNENPYLEITLTENLKRTSQITKTTKKHSTLAFLRRNLRSFPLDCRKSAYTTLVRTLLDYGSIIWDPYLKQYIDKIERVQRQAARFINGDYKTREDRCFVVETCKTEQLKQLFFCENCVEWNHLDTEVVRASMKILSPFLMTVARYKW